MNLVKLGMISDPQVAITFGGLGACMGFFIYCLARDEERRNHYVSGPDCILYTPSGPSQGKLYEIGRAYAYMAVPATMGVFLPATFAGCIFGFVGLGVISIPVYTYKRLVAPPNDLC